MTNDDLSSKDIIQQAIEIVDEMSPQATDGIWLEDVVVDAAAHIREWEVEDCWPWSDWPEREVHFSDSTNQDVGIDVVARRRSDGKYIAIQCKARQLDVNKKGADLHKSDMDSFIGVSSGEFWAERWVVTNGDVSLSSQVKQTVAISGKPLKEVNLPSDLQKQLDAFEIDEECAHCDPDVDGGLQSKNCMQREAVEESVRVLQSHAESNSGGLPKGQARGKIILPCGTGKTRISLRIVEQLTPKGGLSIALCPSIALVAQLRREYLQHANVEIRALAVCSDKKAAGYNPKQESFRSISDDPTLDNSNVSASEVKGMVTTDPIEIAEWIQAGRSSNRVSVIFGTYQSGNAVATALNSIGASASVLVVDEAHRTAGLRKKRRTDVNDLLRDFTLCHDNNAFPATYRVYQTATPRIYDVRRPANSDKPSDWIVRSMDDEATFGVELYRKSYVEAVRNEWLSDYRIIAIGVSDKAAYDEANRLARETISGERNKRNKLNTSDYLRGLAFALAMGGATRENEENAFNGGVSDDGVPIKSCIAFMNRIEKSENMAKDLQTAPVKEWVQQWLDRHSAGSNVSDYSLEHLDARSDVGKRETAKTKLSTATEDKPYGIVNVGIFGEGTDSPSLNAVAFLEARKSPIDVIQAVGRAMRKMEGKRFGYIICPVLIPPDADPETWLSTSGMNEGWRELGQVLLALRAHDSRIEDQLKDLLCLNLPEPPDEVVTIAGIANELTGRLRYLIHKGKPGSVFDAVERGLEDQSTLPCDFEPLSDVDNNSHTGLFGSNEPTSIVTGKLNCDGSFMLRQDGVVRDTPKGDVGLGDVNIRKCKRKARKMVNNDEGNAVPSAAERAERARLREERKRQKYEESVQTRLEDYQDWNKAIYMNLLSKSGLVNDRVIRDLNVLESGISEAAFHMRKDGLQPALDRHFGIDNLKDSDKTKQADGCTIAALLMMNAAMLHQRIANGGWLSGIDGLVSIKNDVNVIRVISRQWYKIIGHDFKPVMEPAVKAVEVMEDTGKLAGLERALRHIVAEAERIAEAYADMGADHAGPLFNRVMGNQASDGAFFTKPVAASIAARLTLDALGDGVDWKSPDFWRENKILDPACGSGTFLAAILADIKRRAREQGASQAELNELQRVAVEDVVKGLDINPVSLQLAASQLIADNHDIRYRRMGLHLMPYGPDRNDPDRVFAGSLELLGQKAIVSRRGEFDIADDRIGSQSVWNQRADDAELEDVVEAAQNARIVVMNPPFTKRAKMGEKFPKEIQQALRRRTDTLERTLISSDRAMDNFVDKNSIRPLFLTLADKCAGQADGILTMINPTIALTAPSGVEERRIIAQRYHIQTVLSCHQPGYVNLSQGTGINESVIVAKRHAGPKPPTRFINLDRMPIDNSEATDLHECLANCEQGIISNGWGEVSYWPAERVEAGDWTAAIWRSPELADSAARFANDVSMFLLDAMGLSPTRTDIMPSTGFEKTEASTLGSLPTLYAKSGNSQTRIQSQPDEYWIPKNRDDEIRKLNGGTYPEVDKVMRRAGYLLITAGQNSSTGRLIATADDAKYVGTSWMPVLGLSAEEAKALAVFLNSTPGRLQLMRNPGRTLVFPTYTPATAGRIRVPNIKDAAVRDELAACWELTRDMKVPQFRDGECEVRRLWDEAVASACGWDAGYLGRLRSLLHAEPHVRGLGYGQYADEISD